MEFDIKIELHAAERVFALRIETPSFGGDRVSFLQFPYGEGCAYSTAAAAMQAALDVSNATQAALRLARAQISGPAHIRALLKEARDIDAESAKIGVEVAHRIKGYEIAAEGMDLKTVFGRESLRVYAGEDDETTRREVMIETHAGCMVARVYTADKDSPVMVILPPSGGVVIDSADHDAETPD